MEENSFHFTDYHFKEIFIADDCYIFIKISIKFIPRVPWMDGRMDRNWFRRHDTLQMMI